MLTTFPGTLNHFLDDVISSHRRSSVNFPVKNSPFRDNFISRISMFLHHFPFPHWQFLVSNLFLASLQLFSYYYFFSNSDYLPVTFMVPVQSICHTISGQFLQDYSWFISCQIVVNFPTCFYFITFPSFLSTIGCRLVSLWSFLDIHRTSLTRCELSLDNSSFPSLSIWTGFYRSTSKSARFWPLWTIPIQFVLNSSFFPRLDMEELHQLDSTELPHVRK